MKILVAVTYFSPYVSGLTIYAERIAKAWVRRGHEVTVLTSRHDPSLPREEFVDGVKIVRCPIWLRISKGAVMPAFWAYALKHMGEFDVVNIHLPQFDAAWVALAAKLKKTFSVLTYHCDLVMPSGWVNGLANRVVLWMNRRAGRFADKVVAYTEDYAAYSFFLPEFKPKQAIIQPPVELPAVSDEGVDRFIAAVNPDGFRPVIGMACRLAEDKGAEILLDALPAILEKYPNACVYFAGPYDNVLGERPYYLRLKARFDAMIRADHWRFLGSLSPDGMAKFYRMIDLLTMPSLNRTDSFGLVQIEAMMNGKPVVASNLPGIRVPVTRHGMGRICEIGSGEDLAAKILDVLGEKRDYRDKTAEIRDFYRPEAVAAKYEEMLKENGIE